MRIFFDRELDTAATFWRIFRRDGVELIFENFGVRTPVRNMPRLDRRSDNEIGPERVSKNPCWGNVFRARRSGNEGRRHTGCGSDRYATASTAPAQSDASRSAKKP